MCPQVKMQQLITMVSSYHQKIIISYICLEATSFDGYDPP